MNSTTTHRNGTLTALPRIRRSFRAIFPLLAGFFLLLALCAPSALAEPDPNAGEQRYVTIDFNDVDINLFIKYISELTGMNFIVDRTVKGKVTIISPTKITEDEAYRVFESVLEVQGFTTVPSGSVTKIIPSVQARSQSIETVQSGVKLDSEDKIVTQIIPLQHIDPETIKRLLAPLVSKTSVVIAHTESGMLILTEFLSNINRLMEIIKMVDVPTTAGEELAVLQLKYATASDIAKALSQLFVKTATAKGQKPDSVQIIPYDRTNSLLVFSSKSNINKVRELLEKIDTETPKGTGKIQVVYLQHANAEELLKVLTQLPDSKSGSAATTDPQAVAASLPISKDVRIMADLETNALIIIGPREEYLVLEEVIRKLDIPRRMVYIEALIMEVSVTKAFELGLQWGTAGATADGTGRLFTGFSGTGGNNPYAGLNNLMAEDPGLGAGFSVGLLQSGIQIGDMLFPNLGSLINAYKDDSDVEIIATPQILTTDNKEAQIIVGENVPFQTSKNVSTGTQDYSSYEYKDVGTTLKILPQINQSDLVRMEISVEVSKVKTQVNDRPTTLKRTANTTVVVRNNETVVMGGIIGQDTSTGQYKVPLLGDIPLIGWLFKTETDNTNKTNLFIFITPRIVENTAELAELYIKKRDVLDEAKGGDSSIPDLNFMGTGDKQHAVTMTDIGLANMQKDNYAKARQFFDQALEIDPGYAPAILNLGVLSEKEGNTSMAIMQYQRAMDIAPVEGEEEEVAEHNKMLLEVQDRAAQSLQRLGFGDILIPDHYKQRKQSQ